MDLQAAALVALSVAKILLEPATYARVGALARLRFVDLSLIDDLADVGRAAWCVRYRVLEADALHADALFPAATLALV